MLKIFYEMKQYQLKHSIAGMYQKGRISWNFTPHKEKIIIASNDPK